MNGEQTAMGCMGAMFGSVAQPDEVAFAENGSVILDQLSFQNQKLLVSIVAMWAIGHAGRHPIDVKSDTKRETVIAASRALASMSGASVDEIPPSLLNATVTL